VTSAERSLFAEYQIKLFKVGNVMLEVVAFADSAASKGPNLDSYSVAIAPFGSAITADRPEGRLIV
jgi:hypothetical protein